MNIGEKGAFIVEGDNKLLLLIYSHLSKSDMKKAIPITFTNENYNTSSVYLCSIFEDGIDYLNQMSSIDIEKILLSVLHIDILQCSFDEAQKLFTKLTLNEYKDFKKFSQEQLRII